MSRLPQPRRHERGPPPRETVGLLCVHPSPPTHGEMRGRNTPGRRFRETTVVEVTRHTASTTDTATPTAYAIWPAAYILNCLTRIRCIPRAVFLGHRVARSCFPKNSFWMRYRAPQVRSARKSRCRHPYRSMYVSILYFIYILSRGLSVEYDLESRI